MTTAALSVFVPTYWCLYLKKELVSDMLSGITDHKAFLNDVLVKTGKREWPDVTHIYPNNQQLLSDPMDLSQCSVMTYDIEKALDSILYAPGSSALPIFMPIRKMGGRLALHAFIYSAIIG